MQRMHSMPFGAELTREGVAQFRLWAPSARSVELRLRRGSEERCVAMTPRSHGWYTTMTPAYPGDRYRYRINGDTDVPDPASRFQPDDVNGASELIDPRSFSWKDGEWKGRPWEEAVIYELHVGSFSSEGTYAGVE